MDDRIPIIGQQIRDQAMENTVLAIIGPALIGHPVIAELIRRVQDLEHAETFLSDQIVTLADHAVIRDDDACTAAVDESVADFGEINRQRRLPRHPLIQREGQPALDPLGEPIVGGAIDEHDIGCTVTILVCAGYGFDALHGQRFEGKDKREALTQAGDAVTAFLAEMGEDE